MTLGTPLAGLLGSRSQYSLVAPLCTSRIGFTSALRRTPRSARKRLFRCISQRSLGHSLFSEFACCPKRSLGPARSSVDECTPRVSRMDLGNGLLSLLETRRIPRCEFQKAPRKS